MGKRIMCVWLPNWPAQRASVALSQAENSSVGTERIDAPKSVGPVVLFRRDPRRGNVVAAANQTARVLGVLPQMPLSQCGAIVPTAIVQEHSPQEDLESIFEFAELLHCFSPIVGMESLAKQAWAGRALLEPQAILLDVTGLARHFGGEEAFAREVGNWFQRRGYLASIAIGISVGQAWALANYKSRRSVSAGMLRWEEMGCRLPPVGGLATPVEDVVIGPWVTVGTGSLEGNPTLQSLPIESLRLDVTTAAKLHRLGVRSVKQLLSLPRASLPARFGNELLERIDALSGVDSELIKTLPRSEELVQSVSLEYATPDRDVVEEVLKSQLRVLAQELRRLELGALRIVSRVALERNAIELFAEMASTDPNASRSNFASVLQVGFFQPTDDEEHMFWLLKTQLDSPAFRLGDVYWAREITTQITLASEVTWRQNSLFEVDVVKHRDSVAGLVNQLSARLGRESVLAPQVFKNPAPEQSFGWRPLTGYRNDGCVQETKRKLRKPVKRDYQEERPAFGPASDDVWRRPTRLLKQPESLRVTEYSSSKIPEVICYPRSNSNVSRIDGPERIQTGWWAGAMEQRDYYRIELENGVWIWCFLDRRCNEWFLHGVFD